MLNQKKFCYFLGPLLVKKLAEQLGLPFSQLGEVPRQQPPARRGQNRHFSKSRGYQMNYVIEQKGQKEVAPRR